jgi:hypothetical protein
VYAASTPNAMMIGHSPRIPIAFSTASMPTSCRAMYGIVATIPVIATISASEPEPKRPRMKSAGVT